MRNDLSEGEHSEMTSSKCQKKKKKNTLSSIFKENRNESRVEPCPDEPALKELSSSLAFEKHSVVWCRKERLDGN